MARKKKTPATIVTTEGEWYTAGEAAKRLSETSGRTVPPSYVNKLATLGKIGTKKVHERLTLYSKPDIDTYKVEARGVRAGQVKRTGKTGPTERERRHIVKEEKGENVA